MDIALYNRTGDSNSDIYIDSPYLEVDKDLQTAVRLSIFSHRLADERDVKSGENRRGWWADSYASVNGSLLGSRLWLLKRSKLTQEVANLAEEYIYEALQWLVEDQVAEAIEVQTEIVKLYTLAISVKIYKPIGVSNFKFSYAWEQL